MSTLGKVLLLLNLLAAAGLTYLTVQDWSKRNEIGGVVLRYHLTLQGLPLETVKPDIGGDDPDLVPVQVQATSGETIQWVRKKLLEMSFKDAPGGDTYGGGGQVLSLHDELNRIDNKLTEQIEKAQNPEGKLRLLVGSLDGNGLFQPALLMTLAESFEERAAVKALAYPTPVNEALATNAEKAVSILKDKIANLKVTVKADFAEDLERKIRPLQERVKAASKKLEGLVRQKNDPANAAGVSDVAVTEAALDMEKAEKELSDVHATKGAEDVRTDEERRRRFAQFFMLLDPTSAWQKRVMLVVGLRTYQQALNEQIARLTDIRRQTERAIESDQATFDNEYELLKRLAVKDDGLVQQQSKIVAGLTEMERADDELKKGRQKQLDDLKKQLDDLKAAITRDLAAQAIAEKEVFELQRKVRDSLQENLKLETTLEQSKQKP